jgi:nitrate/TMAO reductase-like tetraheme cytochrome c subunit
MNRKNKIILGAIVIILVIAIVGIYTLTKPKCCATNQSESLPGTVCKLDSDCAYVSYSKTNSSQNPGQITTEGKMCVNLQEFSKTWAVNVEVDDKITCVCELQGGTAGQVGICNEKPIEDTNTI